MFIATGVVIVSVALLYGLAYPRTQYTPGFSEAGFDKITNGMSAVEVEKILGAAYTWGTAFGNGRSRRIWGYSWDVKGGPLDAGWFVREVRFSRDRHSSNDVVEVKVERFDFVPPWR